MDYEDTSVEMQDVADPAEETGVEDLEAAAPESGARTEADATFARMRRENESYREELEAARNELAELQAQTEARESAFSRLTGNENGEIAALAEVTGMSEDEIRAEMEAAEESARKDLRIQQLEEQVDSIDADRAMQEHLEALRKIDPSIRSLLDLGDEYADYIAVGLAPEQAYWAIKAKEQANHAEPPKAIGKVETNSAERDYFTDAEIDAMSSEQLTKNWKKIMASWDRKANS